jgi:hypothetical protein
MKKLLLLTVTCLLVLSSLYSCEKDIDDVMLIGGPASQTVFANQEQCNERVSFRMTGAWQSSIAYTDNSSWVHIDPASGDEGGVKIVTITISLDVNYTGADRTATITISSGSDDTQITIIQKGTTEYGDVPVYQNKIKEGTYRISYTGGYWDGTLNTASGTPFNMNLVKHDATYYKLTGNWFNNSYFTDPILLGKVDASAKRIVFEGAFINSGGNIDTRNCFNSIFFYSMNSGEQVLVFSGSGEDYTDPIEVSFDDNGYMTAISYFDYTAYNNDTEYTLYGVYDAAADGVMTYVGPVSASAKPASAPRTSSLKAIFHLSKPTTLTPKPQHTRQ